MEENIIYRDGNIIINKVVDSEGASRLCVHDAVNQWSLTYLETSMMYKFFDELIDAANDNEAIHTAISATFHAVYTLSNMGVHDVKASNELAETIDGLTKRISAVLSKDADVEEAEKDAKEWFERSEIMNEMAKEAEKEMNADDGDGSK